MNDMLRKRCELFILNRDKIKAAFGWENTYLYPLSACMYVQKDCLVKVDKLLECKKLLKEKTSVFSNFRGNAKLIMITLLALDEHPEEKLERMLSVYELLRGEFLGSEYLSIASSAIVDMTTKDKYAQVVKRTRSLYNQIKKEHPFITSGEDSAFAAILALSQLSDEKIIEETEKCFRILKPCFASGNAVQSLCHILTLGEGLAEEKCKRVLNLYECLKKKGYKYGATYELATIGPLALIDVDTETLAQEIVEVDEYLKTQKGFGAFGIGTKQRLMYAGMLAMCGYVKEFSVQNTASMNSVVTLLLAQQTAICISAGAAAAAAASSSSS